MKPQEISKMREQQETRIIIAGLLLGAAAGGIVVLVLRLRTAQRTGESPAPLGTLFRQLSWPEVFSTVAAALTIARRIGGLHEPPEETANR